MENMPGGKGRMGSGFAILLCLLTLCSTCNLSKGHEVVAWEHCEWKSNALTIPGDYKKYIVCYKSYFGVLKGCKFSKRFQFLSDLSGEVSNMCPDDGENDWRTVSITKEEDQYAHINAEFTGNRSAKFQVSIVRNSLYFTLDNKASMSTVPLGDEAFLDDYNGLLFLIFLSADMPSQGNKISAGNDACRISVIFDMRPSTTPQFDVTTIPSSKEICTTKIVNAVPATIKDRLGDLPSKCNLAFDENAKCEFQIDYAVRLGCIQCKENITKEEQQIFLGALGDWLKSVNYNEHDKWEGTNLRDCKLTGHCSVTETIRKIEPGQFRYTTIAESWNKNGESVNMLIHNCGAYGLFASAYRIGTPVQSLPAYERYLNWAKDFEFLEMCKFGARRILDKKYLMSEAREGYLTGVRFGFDFDYGTYERNMEKTEKIPYSYPSGKEAAHKFKYGFTDPKRQTTFTSEDYNMFERTKLWGRYFLPPNWMYKQYQKHDMVHAFLKIWPNLLVQPDGSGLSSESDPVFLNAQLHSYINQLVIACGDIITVTLRFNAFQYITYQMKGTGQSRILKLPLRTMSYRIDGMLFAPPDNMQLDDDIHLYKYRFQG